MALATVRAYDGLHSLCRHGRRKGGAGGYEPLDFEIFSKKRLFF